MSKSFFFWHFFYCESQSEQCHVITWGFCSQFSHLSINGQAQSSPVIIAVCNSLPSGNLLVQRSHKGLRSQSRWPFKNILIVRAWSSEQPSETRSESSTILGWSQPGTRHLCISRACSLEHDVSSGAIFLWQNSYKKLKL